MFFKIVKFFIILSLFSATSQSAKRRFSMEFYNYTCQAFGKRLKMFDCSFLKINNENYLFNHKVKFDRDLGGEFKVRVWLDAKTQFSRKYFRGVDAKFEACSFLQQPSEFQLLRSMFKELKKITNFPHQCPFKGDQVYRFDNFSFTSEFVPAYAPACNFIFGVDYYDSYNLFGSVKVMGSLTT